MKVILGSVIYKAAKPYLKDFFDSIVKQQGAKFSVLLINDDMEVEELHSILSDYCFDIEIVNIRHKTPVELRIELLRLAKQRDTDLLISGDCDDYFSETRVKEIVETYKQGKTDFFYNELVNELGEKVMPDLPQVINDIKIIGELNFLGLSNTALNMKKISYDFIDSLEEFQYEIFDWYLFSRLLLFGLEGALVEECYTVYRIHDNNIAGITEYSELAIEREKTVKLKHYKSLKKYHFYYEKKYYQYKYEKQYIHNNCIKKTYWWNLLRIENEK